MFKKVASAYEKLIGKQTGAQFVEDVFANFFNNFFHKYKGALFDQKLSIGS
jgi:hypothetical protein